MVSVTAATTSARPEPPSLRPEWGNHYWPRLFDHGGGSMNRQGARVFSLIASMGAPRLVGGGDYDVLSQVITTATA
jgi:hypothetical protein